ncbi:MAG: hypothetical protein OXL41_02105 [Nitrospinae bacterium]|nr:hypothetical protein [Nitrospinota bacterium]
MYRILKTTLVVAPLFFLASLLAGSNSHAHEANYPHLHIAQSGHGKMGHGHQMHKSGEEGMKKGRAGMKHSVKIIPAAYKNPPSVKIRLEKDAHTKGALNLFLDLKHFRFAPEEVNKTSKINEGHAHLYLNGKKLTRLYSASYFMDKLPKGNLEIRVTLNTNMHEDLSYRGKFVQDVVVFKDFNN